MALKKKEPSEQKPVRNGAGRTTKETKARDAEKAEKSINTESRK